MPMTAAAPAPVDFQGVIPPLLTPLTADGRLDVPSLERLIEHHLAGGVDGLFVLGSSGEVAFFEDEMREQVLTAAVRLVAGRVPVDRKSTRLNSSHVAISYAVFCLKRN